MQVVARLSPATYALEGVRASLLQGSGVTELAGYLLPLLGIGALSIPLGVKVFVAVERFAKRTGRLKPSG